VAGAYDGFDQDEGAVKCDEGAVEFACLLEARGDVLSALGLLGPMRDCGTQTAG